MEMSCCQVVSTLVFHVDPQSVDRASDTSDTTLLESELVPIKYTAPGSSERENRVAQYIGAATPVAYQLSSAPLESDRYVKALPDAAPNWSCAASSYPLAQRRMVGEPTNRPVRSLLHTICVVLIRLLSGRARATPASIAETVMNVGRAIRRLLLRPRESEI